MKNINIAFAVSALVASGAVYSAESVQAQIDNQRSQYVQSVAINTVVSNTNQEGVNVINSIQARIVKEAAYSLKLLKKSLSPQAMPCNGLIKV